MFAVDYLGTMLHGLFKDQKEGRLEPLSAVATLALRSLKSYDKALPAVRADWFEFDKEGDTAKRTGTDVDCLDVVYLQKPIRLFVSGWSAHDNKELVPIVEKAIDGLRQVAAHYLTTKGKGAVTEKKRGAAVDIICGTYITCLQGWLPAAKAEKPPEVKGEKPPEVKGEEPAVKEEKPPVAKEEKKVLSKEEAESATAFLVRLKQDKRYKDDLALALLENAVKLQQEAAKQPEAAKQLDDLPAVKKEPITQDGPSTAQKKVTKPDALSTDQRAFVKAVADLWKENLPVFSAKISAGNGQVEYLETILRAQQVSYLELLKRIPPVY